MSKYLGQKVSMVTVLEVAENRKLPKGGYYKLFHCKCDCGKDCIISGNELSGVAGGSAKRKTISCGCARRKNIEESAMGFYYQQYKDGAKKRDHEFSLTKVDFTKLVSQNCHYCGGEPRLTNGYAVKRKAQAKRDGYKFYEEYETRGQLIINGIDRVDNTIGYLSTNTVSCCDICNRAKRAMPEQDFLEWIKRLALHWTMK